MTPRLVSMLQSRVTRSALRKQAEVTLCPQVITSQYFSQTRSVGKSDSESVQREKMGQTNIEDAARVKESELKEGKRSAKSTEGSEQKRERLEIEYEENDEECRGVDAKKRRSEPASWRTVYANVEQMRRHRDAPVDTMGCDKLSDDSASPQVQRYQVLLSLMLSSQTKDEITAAAMAKLRNHGCTVDNILATPDEKLGELIFPVGFWRRKVEYIKKTSQILKDGYSNDIPDTVQDLCKLPGVGPKMAYLVMKSAWGKVVGIGVDVHVHRICNRLGWVTTKEPEKTRLALQEWLPREYWSKINCLLVGFGQQICLPVKPKCSDCMNKLLCPEGRRQLKGKLKNVKE